MIIHSLLVWGWCTEATRPANHPACMVVCSREEKQKGQRGTDTHIHLLPYSHSRAIYERMERSLASKVFFTVEPVYLDLSPRFDAGSSHFSRFNDIFS